MLKQLKGTRGCCFVSEVCPSNQTVLPVPDKREPEKVSPVHGEQVREATGFGSWSQEILWGECHSEVPWQKSSTWYLKSQNISKYMDLLSKIRKSWWFAFLCAMVIRLFFGSWYIVLWLCTCYIYPSCWFPIQPPPHSNLQVRWHLEQGHRWSWQTLWFVQWCVGQRGSRWLHWWKAPGTLTFWNPSQSIMRFGIGIQDKPINMMLFFLLFPSQVVYQSRRSNEECDLRVSCLFKESGQCQNLSKFNCVTTNCCIYLRCSKATANETKIRTPVYQSTMVFGIACGAQHMYHTRSFSCCRNAKKYYEKKQDGDADDTSPSGRAPKTEKGEKVKKEKTKSKVKKEKKTKEKKDR